MSDDILSWEQFHFDMELKKINNWTSITVDNSSYGDLHD